MKGIHLSLRNMEESWAFAESCTSQLIMWNSKQLLQLLLPLSFHNKAQTQSLCVVYLSIFQSSLLVIYSPPTHTPVCSSAFGGAVSGRALTAAPWANTHTSVQHRPRAAVTPGRICCQTACKVLCKITLLLCLFFFLRYTLLIENNVTKLPVVTRRAGSLQQATGVMLHLPHPILSSQAVQMANDFYKPFFPPRSQSKHLGLATVEM